MAGPSDDQVEQTGVEPPVEDVEEAEATTPYRFTVTSYGADYPVDGLVKRLQSGDIAIPTFDPELEPAPDVEGFQRQFVWTKPQCDRFIESLLLGLPVPGIFLVKQSDGRLLVLDGQQRLRTLAAFYRGLLREREFKLENVQDRSYETVFDLSTAGYRQWSFPAIGLVFVAASAVLRRYRQSLIPVRPAWLRRIGPVLILAFAIL